VKAQSVTRTAALVIAAIAVARCLVTVLSEVWFDVDPLLDSTAPVGLSPSMLILFDMALVAAALVGFVARAMEGKGASLWISGLWVLPIIFGVMIWLTRGAHHAQVIMPWVAGVTAAAALVHFCCDAGTRRLVLAVLVSGVVALGFQAFVQWAWTIPETAAWFDAHRDEALALIGLEPGSIAAAVYERRLVEGGATGWFTSANLLGGMMAALTVLWSALVLDAARRKSSAWIGGVACAGAMLAAAVVGITESLTALLVLIIGLLLLVLYARRLMSLSSAKWLAIGLPILAAAAPILVLWTASPDTSISGVRSLVIRGQYVEGAAGVVADAPLQGSGPGRFQDAWLGARPVGAPEEIVSSHSMLFDWVAQLGVSALGWVILVGFLAWCVGRRLEHPVSESTLSPMWTVAGSVITGFVVIALASVGIVGEWPHLHETERLVRIFGLLSVPVMALTAAVCLRGELARIGVVVAVVVLLLQAQVDMAVWQSATVVWTLAVVGASASISVRGRGRTTWLACAIALFCLVLIGRAWMHQSDIDEARKHAAMMLIAASGDAAGDSNSLARSQAAQRLLDSWETTRDPRLALVAGNQYLLAAWEAGPEDSAAISSLSSARMSGEWASQDGAVEGLWLQLRALDGLSSLREDPRDQERAMSVAAELTKADPTNPMAWVMRARVAAVSGHHEIETSAWQRALRLDDAQIIDPLQRMPKEIRQEGEAAISAHEHD